MNSQRWTNLAAGIALLALTSAGMHLRAQQQAPVPLSPEQLTIPAQPPSPPPSAVLRAYPTVSAERLKKPADGEWLMVRRTYDGWGYSPLEQINTSNVNRLQPVWVMSTGMNNGQEAAPIV